MLHVLNGTRTVQLMWRCVESVLCSSAACSSIQLSVSQSQLTVQQKKKAAAPAQSRPRPGHNAFSSSQNCWQARAPADSRLMWAPSHPITLFVDWRLTVVRDSPRHDSGLTTVLSRDNKVSPCWVREKVFVDKMFTTWAESETPRRVVTFRCSHCFPHRPPCLFSSAWPVLMTLLFYLNSICT